MEAYKENSVTHKIHFNVAMKSISSFQNPDYLTCVGEQWLQNSEVNVSRTHPLWQ